MKAPNRADDFLVLHLSGCRGLRGREGYLPQQGALVSVSQDKHPNPVLILAPYISIPTVISFRLYLQEDDLKYLYRGYPCQ